MIIIDTKTYEKLISDFIDARDIMSLVNNFSKDSTFYYNVLKDISRGRGSANYKILKKVARKKKVSENFIIEQAKFVLGYIAPYDKPGLDKYYDILNVSPDTSDKEIRQQWIELMKSNHPDKVGQGGLDRAKKINEAYEVLSSSKKRIDNDFSYYPDEPIIVKDGGIGSVSKMFLYFVPFILVIAVSYLYLSSSGLLFKSEADKERIAKNVETPTLPKIDIKSEKYYTEVGPEPRLMESERLARKSENIATNDKTENKSPNINKEQEDISEQNKLTNNKLDVGEGLLLSESNLKSNNKYVVKSGDTISQIAEKFGVKTKDLKNTNKLKNDNIRIGQTLYIPHLSNSTNTVVASKDNTATTSVKEEISSSSENIRQESPRIYTVKNGDTLGHIALKFDVSLATLRKANGLKNNNLKIGQVLTVPTRKEKTDLVTQEKPTQTLPNNNKYVVKKGDTLSEIAENHGVRTNDLKKANNLKNHNLQIGQKLVIPDEYELESGKADEETIITSESTLKDSSDATIKVDSNLATPAVAVNDREQRHSELSPDMPAPDEDSLYLFVSQFSSAYKNGDLQTIRSLFAPNAKENGVSLYKVLDTYESNFSTLDIIRYDIKVKNTYVDNFVGVIIGDFIVTYRNRANGLTKSSRGNITWLLRWREHGWKIEEINYKIHNTDVID